MTTQIVEAIVFVKKADIMNELTGQSLGHRLKVGENGIVRRRHAVVEVAGRIETRHVGGAIDDVRRLGLPMALSGYTNRGRSMHYPYHCGQVIALTWVTREAFASAMPV